MQSEETEIAQWEIIEEMFELNPYEAARELLEMIFGSQGDLEEQLKTDNPICFGRAAALTALGMMECLGLRAESIGIPPVF